jgi:uncharacterized protein (TIGR02145 family)
MRKKVIFWMPALILLISTASVNAQVTIGSLDDPHGGAVLDLSKASGSNVGFLLPRVSLDNVDTWQIGGDKAQGEGMAVYNTNNYVVGGEGIGIYVWNGYAWTRVKTGADDACPRVVKDSENNIYSTGWFGAAGCWMTQNLRSTTGLTENATADDASLKYYYYPNNNQSAFSSHLEYGLLYTWAAATDRTGVTDNEENSSHGPHQGICPTGWHLPSDYEWNQLEEEIAKSAANVYSTTTATTWESGYSTTFGSYRGQHGQKMKSTTRVNGQATNGTSNSQTANGFDALLVGDYLASGNNYGLIVYFWSSSSVGASFAWYRRLNYDDTGMLRASGGKYNMMSVRCKKN